MTDVCGQHAQNELLACNVACAGLAAAWQIILRESFSNCGLQFICNEKYGNMFLMQFITSYKDTKKVFCKRLSISD